MRFKKAVRKTAKARIGLSGPSGSGKTLSALLMAAGLIKQGETIGVIDTEKGSASLYAGLEGVPEFDVLELSAPYTPERFIEALKESAAAGHAVTLIDGITPEWSGVGGCLELVDKIAAASYRGNSWSAWNDVTPRHRKFIDAMLSHPGHLIATMRSKTETAQEEDRNGKKKVVKLGMKSEQRDGIEYEFTAVLDIAHGSHVATASKDRTRLWADRDPELITEQDGKLLLQWLESGEQAPTGVDPDMLETALKAISEAPRFDVLKSHYDAALSMAQDVNDTAAVSKIEEACAAAKARITTERAQRAAQTTQAGAGQQPATASQEGGE